MNVLCANHVTRAITWHSLAADGRVLSRHLRCLKHTNDIRDAAQPFMWNDQLHIVMVNKNGYYEFNIYRVDSDDTITRICVYYDDEIEMIDVQYGADAPTEIYYDRNIARFAGDMLYIVQSIGIVQFCMSTCSVVRVIECDMQHHWFDISIAGLIIACSKYMCRCGRGAPDAVVVRPYSRQRVGGPGIAYFGRYNPQTRSILLVMRSGDRYDINVPAGAKEIIAGASDRHVDAHWSELCYSVGDINVLMQYYTTHGVVIIENSIDGARYSLDLPGEYTWSTIVPIYTSAT